MSLPPKAVPKPAAAVGSGPGAGPSPPSLLRPPLPLAGVPVTQQPPSVPPPPPQIARVQPPLEERLYPPQPGVAAVYSVPRPAGPPYTAHDIAKGHPNLAGTPPGHASSPGLSQSPYPSGQNAGATPLVYSPPTQPMNTQPPSRPFATGPRPTHHQFFQRPQMQPARPAIPSNSPSIRPGSQTPTAAVYPPNQPIMMTMTPMPFPSPQTAQYYIPQYRPTPPYVGPPQQYPVQPQAPSTFYHGPGPGDFPAHYSGPPYYAGQTVYTPSPPIIVPTPQQPPPAKREKKPIRIRDPNRGGKDITEEIMSGGSGSRNSTPPAGRPPSTPTPPQFLCSHPHYPHIFYLKSQQLSSQAPDHGPGVFSVDSTQPITSAVDLKSDDKPKAEPTVHKSSSPLLRPVDPPSEKRDTSSPVADSPPPERPELPTAMPVVIPAMTAASAVSHSRPTLPGQPAGSLPSTEEISSAPSAPSEPEGGEVEKLLPELPLASSCSFQVVSVMNGLSDKEASMLASDQDSQSPEPPQDHPLPSTPTPGARTDPQESACTEICTEDPPTPYVAAGVVPALATSLTAPLPPPSLQAPIQAATTSVVTETKEPDPALIEKSETEQLYSKKSTAIAQPAQSAPKTWNKPREVPPVADVLEKDKDSSREEASKEEALEEESEAEAPQVEHPEENGERDAEPLGNGAEHASETESNDSGVTSGDRDHTAGSTDLFPEDSAEMDGKSDFAPALSESVEIDDKGQISRDVVLNPVEPLEVDDKRQFDSDFAPTPSEPVEIDGKRQYDREFLLGFQFMPACVKKPEGLPPISDVVLDKINQSKLPSRPADLRVMSRGPDFTPAFAEFGRSIPGGRGAPLINVNLRRPPPRKIITNVSVNDEVQLKKSENAWKPGMKRDGSVEDLEAHRTQELFRKVRSILNKLTPQMFNQLMKQVTDLTIDTEERLKGVIDLVFEKAIDEPSFSVAYGNMCRCLATLKVPMADKPSSSVNFRKLLLNRCQKEFEKDKMDDDVFERKQKELESSTSSSERERLQEELEEAKDKARRRSIGNIKFIGELFKLKMLTEAIMHDCVVKLLKNHDEESLECLCRLLTTIGKDLDFEKAKPRMDQYFNQMEKIVKERKTSSRIRFMLQDVIDLRLNNWVSRRADQGPKTIEQIHKEAKIEEQEEQRKVHQQLLSKDNKRRPVAQRDDTWNTVPVTKNSRAIDPTKIPKISKPTIDEKIQLGPRAQLSWVKGSSGGAGAKASEPDSSRSGASSLNRFSLLQSSVSQSSAPTSMPSDLDSRRCLSSSRGPGRERNDKPASSVPSRAGPFTRSSTGPREVTESQTPEEPCREPVGTLRQPSSAGEKADVDSSKAREPGKPEPPQDKALLSEEDMERRCRSIIDEFLHINDYKEAVQCVVELDQGPQLQVFVRIGVESTLERSHITRDHMGQLFFQLVQTGILPKAQFFKGFAEILEVADDMAIDVPHIWLYLAELLNPMFREGGISLKELFIEFSKYLLPVGRAGILFSEILHLLCKQMSHKKVGALWRDSDLRWADLLPEGEDMSSFISEQKLEFTISDCSSPTEVHSKRELSPEELNQQLEKLLIEDVAGDEQIFDWVEAHLDESQMSSPPFLRALMTAVCKAAVKGESTSCKVDTATIQKRLPVLLKYLNSDTERQLQALYALQALIVKLDQPPNLLRMFFDCLYDEDVISEDAFYKWEASKDPAEQLGKGVALKSVTAFFTWLREAEEESEDN
ncbi:eukaryotic translation initiation factor 4 gamma 3 isoform X3 [Scleropages formosus]|uniref:eukaryotic translation initiation factor 4 gamma 3 isoform X3 n=1 Tax=Scleropages formosus TaxID=113540 RepID=UPI0010FA714D|nr:eukaryotic translation initiation factor 4 gamma 3-like isoform X3 [Scleropages formosus]